MITPEKEMVHLHVKDDIPYLVGDRNTRSNRHRPVSENIIEHLKKTMLKEVIGMYASSSVHSDTFPPVMVLSEQVSSMFSDSPPS